MISNDRHIRHAYDDELARLGALISQISGRAEKQFLYAIEAIETGNVDLAGEAAGADSDTNALERKIESMVVSVIARRQPMADDLRYIISCLKIAADVERMGDYAKNIARRAIVLAKRRPDEALVTAMLKVAEPVKVMLTDIFDVIPHNDIEKAVKVWEADDRVDALYAALIKMIRAHMAEHPECVKADTHMLFVAKNIERIGDMASNIAETVYYRVNGLSLHEAQRQTPIR